MRCRNCEREFKPNRDWQRFCNKQCQQEWNRFQYRKGELMVAEAVKGNGHLTADDAHQAKWAEIRAEWAEEDRRRSRFLRRF
jgi:hypothetical protein